MPCETEFISEISARRKLKKNKNNRKGKQPYLEKEFLPKHFTRVYTLLFEENVKRKMCPYEIKNKLFQEIGQTARPILPYGRNGILIEVDNAKQSDTIEKLIELNGYPCRTQPHRTFNGRKGLIFLYNMDITDFNEAQQNLVLRQSSRSRTSHLDQNQTRNTSPCTNF